MKTDSTATSEGDFVKGYNYDLGLGVRTDKAKAEMHYLRAAKQGDKTAQYNLAQMYYESGKKADLKKAVLWWTRVAQQGDEFAQCNLGRAYENGEGVRKNLPKAKEWYEAAAKQGEAIAQFNLARLKARAGLRTQAQTAFRSIVPRLKELARRRDFVGGSARTCLAKCAYHGWGMKMSKQQAVKWYRAAAKKGEINALLGLGYCYEDGDGVRQDAKKAKHYFALASRLKNGQEIKT